MDFACRTIKLDVGDGSGGERTVSTVSVSRMGSRSVFLVVSLQVWDPDALPRLGEDPEFSIPSPRSLSEDDAT